MSSTSSAILHPPVPPACLGILQAPSQPAVYFSIRMEEWSLEQA